MKVMITPVEIAKILRAQKANKNKFRPGFDSALLVLGIHLKNKKKKVVVTSPQ